MKLYQLLIESRVDFLKKWFEQEYIKRFRSLDYAELVKLFFGSQRIDPTNNKIYVQWLLREILKNMDKTRMQEVPENNALVGEDAYKWKEYLTIYHKVKNRLPLDKRDINKLSLNELKDIALEYKEKEQEIGTKNEVLDKKYKILENNEYLVYMFKNATEQDFQFYQLVSTNTEWCTRPNYSIFKGYINRSPLFVFINKKNRSEKYQFHEQSSQFMDKDDKEIDYKLKIYFIKLISGYLPEDFIMRIRIDNSWGFIDKKGNIIAKGFKWVGSFSEGFAEVIFQDDSFGFINNKGNIIAKGFKAVYLFYEGFACIQFQDNSYGFINRKGNIIAKGFEDAYLFSEGFAKVQFQDNSWGFIDNKGNIYEEDKKTLIGKNDPRLKGIEIYPEKFI